MIKLKLGNKTPAPDRQNQTQPQQSSQNTAPLPATPSGSAPPVKLKLNVSQPPTPVEQREQPSFPAASDASAGKKKRPYQRKQDGSAKSAGKKRAADDNAISPAAKRLASGAAPAIARKLSIKLPGHQTGAAGGVKSGARLSLAKRKASLPKLLDIRARGKAPPRPKGVGYDSEDSDVEEDPAIQQALVLRMQEGEDADYLREAVAAGKIGPHPSQGDAEVSLRFVEKNYRRAVIKVRGRMYAAALVDLPCIVESMKSFDKKGWWKMADIAQMLLVLGQCTTEEEARTFRLPRDVNKENFQYAHGLTPPMHFVRKRRFRKRMSYNDKLSVEEEVARLLRADREWEASGGVVDNEQTRMDHEQSVDLQDYEDAEGAIETVETDGPDADADDDGEDVMIDLDADDLEAALIQEMGQQEVDDASAAALELESTAPVPLALLDQAAAVVKMESATGDDFLDTTPTPAPQDEDDDTEAQHGPEDDESDDDESESDDDDDDDASATAVVDEDAVARAAERAQQMDEVADLEREVARARHRAHATTNQLLRQREMHKLAALEEDLRVKRSIFGLEQED